MLSVVLTILKIIGIVLLSVLGLIIFILLLVLFVPIRYRINASKTSETDKFKASGKVTWLLHLLNVHISYPSDEMFMIRISFFKLYPRKHKDKTIKTSKPPKAGKSKPHKEEQISEDDERIVLAQEIIDKTEEVLDEVIDENAAEEEKATLKGFVNKVCGFLKNIKLTVISVYDKIKSVFSKITHIIDVIGSNKFQIGFKKCKKELLKLLKKFIPKKIYGYVKFGFEDPSTTGAVLGYYSLAFPLIGPKLKVLPDFENQVTEFDVSIKGRITIISVLIAALKVYFDKDIKRFFNLIKKEFSNG